MADRQSEDSPVRPGGGGISFGAKAQTVTAQLTVGAELTAVSYGLKEAVCLSKFLGELVFKSFNSVPVNCDSTGATVSQCRPILQLAH